MKKLGTVFSHTALFLLLLAFLYTLLSFSAMIDNSLVRENFEKSVLTYKTREAFGFTDGNRISGIEDNYADTILLNISYTMGKGENPFVSSLDTKYYNGEELGHSLGLYYTVTDDTVEANTDYTRYWHGSASVIRFLHLFTDVSGIRLIGFCTALVFAVITVGILLKHKHYSLAAAFAFSLVCVQIWNVRLSLEYIPAFAVGFLMCILYLVFERKSDGYLTYLSVAGGTLIAFFDFLTAETVSILLPLTLVIGVRAFENRLGDFKKNLFLLLKNGFCWLGAYASAFVIKWLLASIVTVENKFINALSGVSERAYGEIDMLGENTPLIKQAILAFFANLTALFGGEDRVVFSTVLVGVLVSVLVFGSVFYLFHKKEGNKTAVKLLLMLSGVVFVRFIVLSNHSYMHGFFTYRALVTPIMALFISMLLYMEFPVNKKGKGRKYGKH